MGEFLLSKNGSVLLKATHKYISKKKGKNGKWEYDYGQTGKGVSKRSKEQVSNAQAKDIIAFKEKGLSIEEISDLTGVSTIMVRDTLRVGKEMVERKKNEKSFRGVDPRDIKKHVLNSVSNRVSRGELEFLEEYVDSLDLDELKEYYNNPDALMDNYIDYMDEVKQLQEKEEDFEARAEAEADDEEYLANTDKVIDIMSVKGYDVDNMDYEDIEAAFEDEFGYNPINEGFRASEDKIYNNAVKKYNKGPLSTIDSKQLSKFIANKDDFDKNISEGMFANRALDDKSVLKLMKEDVDSGDEKPSLLGNREEQKQYLKEMFSIWSKTVAGRARIVDFLSGKSGTL